MLPFAACDEEVAAFPVAALFLSMFAVFIAADLVVTSRALFAAFSRT